jgi:hypothetical protein
VVDDGTTLNDACTKVADYCKAIAINVSGYARKVSVAWTFVAVCMIVAWSYSKIHPIMAQKRAIRRLVQR